MNKILLATDGSKPSLRAEEYISDVYDPSEDIVSVVSIAHIPDYLLEYIDVGPEHENPFDTDVGKTFLHQAEEIAENVKQRLIAEGFDVKIVIRQGTPGVQICEVAENKQVDCIVTGKRGQSSKTEPLLGSVSQYVLHNAPCPVNVVPYKSN